MGVFCFNFFILESRFNFDWHKHITLSVYYGANQISYHRRRNSWIQKKMI